MSSASREDPRHPGGGLRGLLRAGARRRVKATEERLDEAVGGSARRRVVVLFACVLALNTADLATVGAVAGQLERALRITNTDVGLLVAASSLVAAIATVPTGWLTDRVCRVHLLGGSIVLWSAAMIASGAAGSFAALLVARLALGAVTATSGPTVASLVGDFFPSRERARMYGFILSGELIGAGAGFVISGDVASALSWRFAFWLLAIPGLTLAVAILKLLPEPARGGQSQIEPGAERIVGREEAARDAAGETTEQAPQMSLWAAMRYVLSVHTNVLLIASSALGYFFLAGLQTFAVVYLRDRYGLSQAVASTLLIVVGAGALAGILGAGRVSDLLARRGREDARVIVPAVAFLLAAGAFVPGLLIGSLGIALPFIVVAAAALSATNPPLDAARLDLMPSFLWGRAEAVRTLLRTVAVAIAPLLFGVVSDALGGHASSVRPAGTISSGGGPGLEYAFLIMVVSLAAAGVILLRARRTYPRDVAAVRKRGARRPR